MINEDDLLTLAPLEDYKTPDLPTLEKGKPSSLKKVPARWKKKAMIVAISGYLGALPLAGCSANQNDFTRYDCGEGYWLATLNNFAYDLCVRLHHGGFGSAFYVAHLTEQEVFGMIKARLEEAGFNFTGLPPYYIETRFSDVALDLFDEERSVGIAHISWPDSNRAFSSIGREYSDWLAKQFAEQINDIKIGVFNTPGAVLDRNNDRITAREARDIRPTLLEDLNEQLEDFIAQLQEEGIID